MILDLDLKILECNNFVSSLINAGLQNVIGKHMFIDFRTDIEIALQTTEQVQQAIRDKTELQMLSINFLRTKEYILLLINYSPVINKDTGDIIAISVKGQKLEHPISWYKWPRLIGAPVHATKKTDVSNQDGLLSDMELEVLFLLFHTDSYADIAEMIYLQHNKRYSANYIGKIIHRNIMPKFDNASHISSLKAKAVKLNYHKKIPLSLMREVNILLETF